MLVGKVFAENLDRHNLDTVIDPNQIVKVPAKVVARSRKSIVLVPDYSRAAKVFVSLIGL